MSQFRTSNGKEGYLEKKVLLKLSSTFKLRNFDNDTKMIAMAPHHWFVQSSLGSYISFGVGCCFIHSKGNARAKEWDKAISSHTFFFIRYSQGIGWHSFKIIMRENLSVVYETPQAEVINLELEQAVLQGSEKDDPDITIPGMGWDD